MKYIVPILFIFFISCKENEVEKRIKRDLIQVLSNYDYYYGLSLNTLNETERISKYVFDNYDYYKPFNEGDFKIEIVKEDSLLLIKSQKGKISNITIKLNNVAREVNHCHSSSILNLGFFSKELIQLENNKNNLFTLHEKLNKSFVSSVGIPLFIEGDMSRQNNDNIVVYKYDKGNISLLCSKYNDNSTIKNVVRDSLDKFISSYSRANYDYALIPVAFRGLDSIGLQKN